MPATIPRDDKAVEMRAAALRIFQNALAAANIDQAFARHIYCERGVLRVCEDLYDLNEYSRVLVVSMGKAAHTMAEALQSLAGGRFEGIIAGSRAVTSQLRGFRYFQGGHPLPNGESIQAAQAILKSLSAQTQSSLVIYLLSGGGSSMVEKPIDDEISLGDLIAAYQALVHSGAAINEINAIRKHLSLVKGGRMAQTAYPARQVSLLVSDVPETALDALASGPTMPDSTSVDDCYSIANKYSLARQFPPSIRELFERHALEETPKSDDFSFHKSRWWTLLSNASLVDAAKAEAARLGFHVEVDNACDDWGYIRAADYLLERLRELRLDFDKVCLLSGGEVTVKVSDGGIGGRNQQFALACALKIAGENIVLLSAGTDGLDGNSPAAGAVVDGSTIARGKNSALDPEVFLDRFNAFPFFEKIGDAIVTGPTGNNLRDLRILLAY